MVGIAKQCSHSAEHSATVKQGSHQSSVRGARRQASWQRAGWRADQRGADRRSGSRAKAPDATQDASSAYVFRALRAVKFQVKVRVTLHPTATT